TGGIERRRPGGTDVGHALETAGRAHARGEVRPHDAGGGRAPEVLAHACALREAALLVEGDAQLAAGEREGVAGTAAIDPDLRPARAAQGLRGVEVHLDLAPGDFGRLPEEHEQAAAVALRSLPARRREQGVGPGAGARG